MPGRVRCVLLFARSARKEARLKQVAFASPLFEYARDRIAAAVAGMAGVDLLVCSDDPAAPLPQRGVGFGERLSNAFADARRLGYREILAVGADSPGLGKRHLAAAFARLATHDVVLGRAADGGVYLIGTRCEPADLLRDVPWRTGSVCARLAANAQAPAFLDDRLADVDAAPDLAALRRDVTLDPAARLLLHQLLAPDAFVRPIGQTPPAVRSLLPRFALRGPPVSLAGPAII